jgi:hypothetical protein
MVSYVREAAERFTEAEERQEDDLEAEDWIKKAGQNEALQALDM